MVNLFGFISFENHAMKKKKILCVDDEQDMLDLYQVILEGPDYKVQGVNNGKKALEDLRKFDFDLVVLDLMLPGMDGWEIFQQMKMDNILKEIPVIIVTAKAQSIDKVLGIHVAKADDYISKPFRPKELLGSVNQLLK
jgi:two-component system, OmpR family, response regulator VicR